jgi:formiminoglutamate deiminase
MSETFFVPPGNGGKKQSLWFEQALLESGWAQDVRLEVSGGLIARIDTGVPVAPEDERHAIALPGISNLHSHAFQRAMAGLTEWRGDSSDNFWSWRERMYAFLDRIGPDEQEAIASLAYMEMLEAGFTRVGEFHYVHNDPAGAPYANGAEMSERIVAAAKATGLGLTMLPVFYAHADFGGQPPKPGQRRFITDLDRFHRLVESCHGLTRYDDALTGVAPHSLRAVTDKELASILEFAGEGPIHIHAAEQVREVEASVAFFGQCPVEWLLDHAAVDARWCLIHATHMTPEETKRLAAAGAVAGLCPLTEANLGDGIFPSHAYLAAGGAFGIGSDSIISISVAEELRLMEYAQRLQRRERNVLAFGPGRSTGTALFTRAVTGGARALGIEGHLKVGAAADIVSLDAGHPNLVGRTQDDILDSYIFAGSQGAVDCVWRYGRKCVTGGRHMDRDAIVATYRKTFERLTA